MDGPTDQELPELSPDKIEAYFTLSDRDCKLVRESADTGERLGIAAQLCVLRWLGEVPEKLSSIEYAVWSTWSRQLELHDHDRGSLACYEDRRRRRHLELVAKHLGFRPWDEAVAEQARIWLSVRELDAAALHEWLRVRKILRPSAQVLSDLIDAERRGVGPLKRSRDPPFGIGDAQPLKLEADAFAVLVDGEQRLLTLFDARQDRADTRLAATATGAVALPAVTFALHSLKLSDVWLIIVYGLEIVLIIAVLILRSTSGMEWRARTDGRSRGDVVTGPRRREKLRFWRRYALSAESFESDRALKVWWANGPGTDLFVVQSRALDLWRTRAQRSRELAHRKEKAAAKAIAAFAILFLVIVLIATGKATGLLPI